MRHDTGSAESLAPTLAGDAETEILRLGHRAATGRAPTRRAWLVRFEGGEERIEADAVEITASGVLAFYRLAPAPEQERTLLTAFSPGLCWRCELRER